MQQNSLRFNTPKEWYGNFNYNIHFFGIINLIKDLKWKFEMDDTSQRGSGHNKLTKLYRKPRKMIEIGSYKGESTLLFAASGIFDEIHCIDPHDGYEEANDIFGNTWDDVYSDFKHNTSQFGNLITHHRDYSYNVVNRFNPQDFDFVYIDGAHDYDSVMQDLGNYSSKTNSIIGGHDYMTNSDVTRAVNDYFGKPNKHYEDGSWMVYKKRGKYYSL